MKITAMYVSVKKRILILLTFTMAFFMLVIFSRIAHAEEIYLGICEDENGGYIVEELDLSDELTYNDEVLSASTDMYTIQFNCKYMQSDARKMLALVNDFRTSGDGWYWNSDNITKTMTGKLAPLTYDYDLEKTAMQRCAETAVIWSHTRTNGTKGSTTLTEANYPFRSRGENIAYGTAYYYNYVSFFDLWKEENENYSGQGHRRIMLTGSYNKIGIAGLEYQGMAYWVMVLTTSDNNSSETVANDSNTVVNVNLYDGYITERELVASSKDITINVNDSVDIPQITANITCINTVGNSQKSAVVPACTYSIADTSVAKIENGKILGIKNGETTLTVSALGTSTTIKIAVSGEISAEPVTTIAGISLAIFENTAGDVVIHLDIPQGQENDTLLTIEQVNSNGQTVLKMHCPSFFLDLIQAGDTYNRYSTTFPIAITDMNNQLIITAYHGYDIVDTMVCTTSDYLTIVAKGNTKYSALATAMLNYATAAQNYFGTDVLHPANAGLDAQYRNITVLPSNTFEGYNINGYASYNGADRVQGITYLGSSLVLDHMGMISLRHYMTITPEMYPNIKSTSYLADRDGIYHTDLIIGLSDLLYNNLVIHDKTDYKCASTIDCSVLAYMNAVFSNPNSDYQLKILLSALYRAHNEYILILNR